MGLDDTRHVRAGSGVGVGVIGAVGGWRRVGLDDTRNVRAGSDVGVGVIGAVGVVGHEGCW